MVYDSDVRRTNKLGVRATGLGKRFGEMWALRDVDVEVSEGRVLGLLGHNGAGKTTMLRILTTLALPSEGSAEVAGHDVVTEATAVRRCIGVASQAATVDGLLTARANLEMIGRLYQLPAPEAKKRARDLLERVSLVEHSEQLVRTFSGGMRRRLDLAASLISNPKVLFLDEPTTGLDPHARNDLWALLRERVDQGATLVLTTQYLEEADRLADDIVLLDHGRVVARGRPSELKAKYGGERLVITVGDPAVLATAEVVLAPFLDGPTVIEKDEKRLIIPVRTGTRLVEVVRALDAAGIDAHDVSRRDPTLDDVFLALTGAATPRTEVAA